MFCNLNTYIYIYATLCPLCCVGPFAEPPSKVAGPHADDSRLDAAGPHADDSRLKVTAIPIENILQVKLKSTQLGN
jgi:hypothetical protein